MPYCAVILEGEDSYDLQVLEDHMTVGLETVEDIKKYVEHRYLQSDAERFVVRILDMQVHEFVAMPQMPMLGRQVVETYEIVESEEGLTDETPIM